MTNPFVCWIVFIAMIIGGFAAGGPAAGVFGISGLWAIACSYKAAKNGSPDRRYKTVGFRALVGIICIVVAFLCAE